MRFGLTITYLQLDGWLPAQITHPGRALMKSTPTQDLAGTVQRIALIPM
jgi:hypothetical protein